MLGLDIFSLNRHITTTLIRKKRMILACPDCATRFKIADEAVGTNGRTVRCSQCSSTWFVSAEPDALSLDEAEKLEELREEVIREPVIDPIADVEATSELMDGNIDSHSDIVSNTGSQDVGPHAMIRDNAERKKVRRRLMGVGMIWIITLGILAVFALAAYLFRAQISAKYPGAAPIYKSIGLEANSTGLKIYDLRTSEANIDGVEVLTVRGKIKNFDIKPRDVGMVRLNFKNDAGEVLASWVVEPPKSVLVRDETITFTSQYPNRPLDASKLDVEFVNESQSISKVPLVSQ